jgi:hypothetical protein
MDMLAVIFFALMVGIAIPRIPIGAAAACWKSSKPSVR